MAANTAVNIGLQSRDWELLMGWIGTNVYSSTELSELIYDLRKYYKAQVTKPTNTTIVTIASTEQVVVDLYGRINDSTTRFFVNAGANPYNRISTALKALNNVADNYITGIITTLDNSYSAGVVGMIRQGRKNIMGRDFDSPVDGN